MCCVFSLTAMVRTQCHHRRCYHWRWRWRRLCCQMTHRCSSPQEAIFFSIINVINMLEIQSQHNTQQQTTTKMFWIFHMGIRNGLPSMIYWHFIRVGRLRSMKKNRRTFVCDGIPRCVCCKSFSVDILLTTSLDVVTLTNNSWPISHCLLFCFFSAFFFSFTFRKKASYFVIIAQHTQRQKRNIPQNVHRAAVRYLLLVVFAISDYRLNKSNWNIIFTVSRVYWIPSRKNAICSFDTHQHNNCLVNQIVIIDVNSN